MNRLTLTVLSVLWLMNPAWADFDTKVPLAPDYDLAQLSDARSLDTHLPNESVNVAQSTWDKSGIDESGFDKGLDQTDVDKRLDQTDVDKRLDQTDVDKRLDQTDVDTRLDESGIDKPPGPKLITAPGSTLE